MQRNQSAEYEKTKEFIFGTHAIMEAIHAGKPIDRLLICKHVDNPLNKELRTLARKQKIASVYVPIEKLNKITRKNHQGAIAYISIVDYSSLDFILDQVWNQGKMPLIMILDRITDTRNLGAIARSAECVGANAIVVPEKSSARINGDSVKTSSGALLHLPVCRVKSIPQVVDDLNQRGLITLGLTEKTKQTIYNIDLKTPLALVVGSEDTGLQPEVRKRLTKLAQIPLYGKVKSLNVSVAAGIALFETARQRLLSSK